MTYKLQLTKEADEDLVGILMYSIETFEEQQAEFHQKELKIHFDKISKMPSVGHSRPDIPIQYSSYNIGQHVFVYTINPKNRFITIIRILHSRMDFSQRF